MHTELVLPTFAVVLLVVGALAYLAGYGTAQNNIDETLIRNPIQLGDHIFVGGDPLTGDGSHMVMLTEINSVLNKGTTARFEQAPLYIIGVRDDGFTYTAEPMEPGDPLATPSTRDGVLAFLEERFNNTGASKKSSRIPKKPVE